MIDDYRTAIAAWLTELGVTTRDVPTDSDLYITGDGKARTLHYEAYLVNADGARCYGQDNRPVREPRTVPVTVEPPAIWRPHRKPARETLLAAVEAVRNELDRMAALPVVAEDTTRADRFAVGARWAIRMVRENALDKVMPHA